MLKNQKNKKLVINSIDKEINRLTERLTELETYKAELTDKPDYTWKSLVMGILKNNGKMKTADIYKKALKVDPTLKSEKRRSIMGRLSGQLSSLAHEGKITSEKISDKSNANYWSYEK